MKVKLTADDRNAIDLLLDHAPAATGQRGQAYAPTVPGNNVRAVEKVLHLLQALPAPEPSADLLNRTLAKAAIAPASSVHPAHSTSHPPAHRPA